MATTKKTAEPKTFVNDNALDRESMSIGEILNSEPKVTVMMAPDPKDPMFRCTINGYTMQFPKGELIEVPESVATLIRQSKIASAQKSAQEAALIKGMVYSI